MKIAYKSQDCFKMVGLNVKKARIQNGLTQSELAKRAGIALISLGKIERGEYGAKLETLFNIASVLNIKLAELLADEDTLFLNKKQLSLLLNIEESNHA